MLINAKESDQMNIYADNAATTKMSKTAIDAMLPMMEEVFGNPSTLYQIGQRAKEKLEEAREPWHPSSTLPLAISPLRPAEARLTIRR